MKYKIVTDSDIKKLIDKVNQEISNGWIPLGGISVTLSESDEYCYFEAAQAMTLTE